VIVGTVIDDAMEDRLRVTMIATGLGGAQTVRSEQRTANMTLVERPR
jgi:cell division GTPase FtsZ